MNPFSNSNYNLVFNQLYVPLCRYCIKLVNNHEAAEDIVQEQFIFLWENWARLKDIDYLQAYMYTSVKNRSLNHIKKNFTEKKIVAIHDIKEPINDKGIPNPQELIEGEELEKLLEKALEKLPKQCRKIFALKRFGQMTNQEIADSLNISIKSVEAQMTIALRRLKSYVIDNWGVIALLLFLYALKIF
jgi:RNA polymerase sigma-70 factor (family 1)